MLLVKAKRRWIEGSLGFRLATMSILRFLLLSVAECSSGTPGGSAEEKDHSSSSLAAGTGAGAGEGVGAVRELKAAKGSCATAFVGGGEKADREATGGCGVTDLDPGAEGKDENWEKELAGGGVGDATGPLALLFWVTEESNGPPGISASC